MVIEIDSKGRSLERRDRREKLMVLRCIIKKKNANLYIGECLELGIVTQGKTAPECRQNIDEAVEAYIEAARQAENDNIYICPATLYRIKRWLFDFYYHRDKKIKRHDCFITERSVPVGI